MSHRQHWGGEDDGYVRNRARGLAGVTYLGYETDIWVGQMGMRWVECGSAAVTKRADLTA